MKNCMFASIAIVLVQVVSASAVVIEQPVTPGFIKQHPRKFSVRATKLADGRFGFTIVRKLERPAYLVARFQVREAGRVVAEMSHPSFALEQRETYHLTVSPDQLDESVFEISERSFGESNGLKVPFVGGIDYVIRLKEFSPAASEPPPQLKMN